MLTLDSISFKMEDNLTKTMKLQIAESKNHLHILAEIT